MAAARIRYLLSYSAAVKACLHLRSLLSACHYRFNSKSLLLRAAAARAAAARAAAARIKYLLSYGATVKACLHLHLSSLLSACHYRFNSKSLLLRAAAARAAAARIKYLLSCSATVKACFHLHLSSLLSACHYRFNSKSLLLRAAAARAAAARAAAARILYLFSYGSIAKAFLLFYLGSLLSACQSVLCRLPLADSLHILPYCHLILLPRFVVISFQAL